MRIHGLILPLFLVEPSNVLPEECKDDNIKNDSSKAEFAHNPFRHAIGDDKGTEYVLNERVIDAVQEHYGPERARAQPQPGVNDTSQRHIHSEEKNRCPGGN